MIKKALQFFIMFFLCINVITVYFVENAQASEEFAPNHYYATATSYGVKIRNGPGIRFKENDLKLNKNAYSNAPKKILYDDYLFGLILDNTIIKGDGACSAWQKIVAVHTSWDSEEIIKPLCETKNGTNNFACFETAYVCKDFIKTSPIFYTTKNNNALIEHFRKINQKTAQ